MNTVVTSKQEILAASRRLVQERGWKSLSIRPVADACGVSVGSIYNYFDSKADLVASTVESIWHDVFHRPGEDEAFEDAVSCMVWLFQCVEYGGRRYPGFFALHSVTFLEADKPEGKRTMQRTWDHILKSIQGVLERDRRVRPGSFDEGMTVEQFANVLFSLLLSALVREDYDPSPAVEVVKRCLY